MEISRNWTIKYYSGLISVTTSLFLFKSPRLGAHLYHLLPCCIRRESVQLMGLRSNELSPEYIVVSVQTVLEQLCSRPKIFQRWLLLNIYLTNILNGSRVGFGPGIGRPEVQFTCLACKNVTYIASFNFIW